jgi:hypothetical protein
VPRWGEKLGEVQNLFAIVTLDQYRELICPELAT